MTTRSPTRTASCTCGQLSIKVQGEPRAVGVCPVCGTTVFHTEDGFEHRSVGVAVGAFADPTFPPPQDSVYDCRRHPWVQLPPGIRVHDKDPE